MSGSIERSNLSPIIDTEEEALAFLEEQGIPRSVVERDGDCLLIRTKTRDGVNASLRLAYYGNDLIDQSGHKKWRFAALTKELFGAGEYVDTGIRDILIRYTLAGVREKLCKIEKR